MDDALDNVWKALADPCRRRLLDLLRQRPKTTGELCEDFNTSRFAVMKHLRVLEEAGLVVVRREGRQRWNYLNPVPIQAIYERWITPYAGLWANELLDLKHTVERDEEVRKGKKHVNRKIRARA